MFELFLHTYYILGFGMGAEFFIPNHALLNTQKATIMNISKFVISVGAICAFVLAMPYRVEDNGVCELIAADYARLGEIIKTESNPELTIADWLGECRFKATPGLTSFLLSICKKGNYMLYNFFYDRINFEYHERKVFLDSFLSLAFANNESQLFKFFFQQRNFSLEERDQKSTHFLFEAIQGDKMDIADFMLTQDFRINHYDAYSRQQMYHEKLAEIKGLVSRHPKQAAKMAPRIGLFRTAMTLQLTLSLVELARYCVEQSQGPNESVTFDTRVLVKAIAQNSCLSDDEKIQVVTFLRILGAGVNEEVSNVHGNTSRAVVDHPCIDQPHQAIVEFQDLHQ